MGNIVCTVCKADIPDRSLICPECGSSIANITVTRCPECLNPIALHEEICSECGFNLAMTSEATESSDASAEISLIENTDEGYIADNAEQQMAGITSAINVEPLGAGITASSAATEQIHLDLQTQIESLNNIVQGINEISVNSGKSFEDMLNKLKEQNLMALSGFQEIISNFRNEMKIEINSIKEATAATAKEINMTADKTKEQMKEIAAKSTIKAGNVIDYTLYISIAALLFSMVNLFITAYILRLIK